MGRAQPGLQHGRKAIAHIGKIFVEMLDDFSGTAEGCEHVDETKHLHFEMLVAHRESHHALVKPGLAENRFGMLIDELKNASAAPLDFQLQ